MKPDAGKDKSADKLAGVISALASADTKSPNSSMPPPELLAQFAKIDTSFAEFFKAEYAKQQNHERRIENSLARNHFIIRLMDYALPLLCMVALAITVFFGDDLAEKIVLGTIIFAIYLLRTFRNYIAKKINSDKKKQPRNPSQSAKPTS